MDCSLPGSSIRGISQARILEWVCQFLLQGIFPAQGLNLHLLHWQEGSLPLSHQESPSLLKMPPIPRNRILRFDWCSQLDIFINEMRLFLGLEYLKIFLLPEEYQKASGTNQISFKCWEKKMFNSTNRQGRGKNTEKKVAFLFLSISFRVTVTYINSLLHRFIPVRPWPWKTSSQGDR